MNEGAGMVRTLGKVSGGVLCGIGDVFTNLHACPVSFVVKVELRVRPLSGTRLYIARFSRKKGLRWLALL